MRYSVFNAFLVDNKLIDMMLIIKKGGIFNSKLQIVRNKQWKDRDALEEKS